MEIDLAKQIDRACGGVGADRKGTHDSFVIANHTQHRPQKPKVRRGHLSTVFLLVLAIQVQLQYTNKLWSFIRSFLSLEESMVEVTAEEHKE